MTKSPTPMAFFQAKENKPENLAAASARLFLGLRVECAQCHDHPFARWKRNDFWSHAAFFAGVEPQPQNGLFSALRQVFDRREIAVPGTKEIVEARYLTGEQPTWQFGVPARQTLSGWITSRDNPVFRAGRRQSALEPVLRDRPGRADRRPGRAQSSQSSRAAGRIEPRVRREPVRSEVPDPLDHP